MESLTQVYGKIKPIFHTFVFEIRLQMKKSIIFSIIIILQLFLLYYIRLIFGSYLFSSLDMFYSNATQYFAFILLPLIVCFFFSGIICSEYKDKTGLTILPLINKYKLIIGKYFANLFLIIGIATIHYLILILLGYNFYGKPIPYTWIRSYGFSVLYILGLGSIVTFFSSFISSPPLVIILVFGLIFFAFPMAIDPFFSSLAYPHEFLRPIFSLDYLSGIITDLTGSAYLTSKSYIRIVAPALVVLLFYAIIFFILALLLFKRREL